MSRKRATLTLAERMRRFGLTRAPVGSPVPGSSRPGATPSAPRRRPVPESAPVPGEVVENAAGSCIVNVFRLPFEHRHGDTTLGDALAVAPGLAGLAGRDPEYRDVPVARRLYLDTETSSLHSGAGVFVFLVGVAAVEDEAVVIRQLFMRHPGEEAAMFRALDELLRGYEALVSFHGKSFDCPRLRDRLLYQNLPDQLPRRAHLDLLHASRQLFRHRHPSCRLQILERSELGFQRHDDLPGAECPEAWFAYQRGEENRIARIMEHNRDDLLSLITLEARLSRLLEQPRDPFQSVAAGLLYSEAAAAVPATQHLEAAAAGLPDPLPEDLLSTARALRVTAALRRFGSKDAALALLFRLHAQRPADPRIVTALAIALERDHGDRERAGRVLAGALRVLPSDAAKVDDLRARHDRLLGARRDDQLVR